MPGAEQQQLERVARVLRAAVDVPVRALGRQSEPPLRIAKRVRPSECSLSVQFQTSGSSRSSSPASAASCHSSSVGSRAPAGGGVRARLGEVEPGQRRAGRVASTSRTPIANAAARRRPLDLDEVVQPRRQRLPLLDVRRLAVGAGLAPPEDGGQRRAARRATKPVGRRVDADDRRRARGPPRAPGSVAIAAAGATITCSVPTNAAIPPRRDLDRRARRPARRRSPPRFATVQSVVSPSLQREATTRVSGLAAASGVHSPVASRSA